MKSAAAALCALLLAAGCAPRRSEPSPTVLGPSGPASSEALLHPESAVEEAPAAFKARFATTAGDFTVEVHRAWSPRGADRFYNLVKLGYYDGVAFFRDIPGFMVQFGIHGSPEVSLQWRQADIPDDPPAGRSNARGVLSFATAGPGTRTTQVFINFGDNSNLDRMGFTPFGEVVSGMDVVDRLYGGYGEGAPRGAGPDQGRLQREGNDYLRKEFPRLDYVKTARLTL